MKAQLLTQDGTYFAKENHALVLVLRKACLIFFVNWSFFLVAKRLLYFAKCWFVAFFPFAKSTQWRWPSIFFRCFSNIVAIFSSFCLQLKLISSYWPIKMSHLHYQTRYGMGLFSVRRANLNWVELKINEAKPNLRWSNQAKPSHANQS